MTRVYIDGTRHGTEKRYSLADDLEWTSYPFTGEAAAALEARMDVYALSMSGPRDYFIIRAVSPNISGVRVTDEIDTNVSFPQQVPSLVQQLEERCGLRGLTIIVA